MTERRFHNIETPDGIFRAYFSSAGLAQLHFPDQSPPPRGASDNYPPVEGLLPGWIAQTAEAVRAVLDGRKIRNPPPLDLSAGTEFRQRVWRAMSSIQPGETLSYGQLAEQIGAPRAVRAVGGACGANPIPLLIPCHRVLAKGGRIGGFSGGLHWKRLLLERESPESFALVEEKSKLGRAEASVQTRL